MLGTEREPGDVLGAAVTHDDLRAVGLRDGALPAHVRVAVGPPVRALADVRGSLTAAQACAEHDGWGSAPDAVMDCVELTVPRLVHAVQDDGVWSTAEYGALLVAVELETARRAARG